jgi:hypothetical protein
MQAAAARPFELDEFVLYERLKPFVPPWLFVCARAMFYSQSKCELERRAI